jgi:hypothetical protein
MPPPSAPSGPKRRLTVLNNLEPQGETGQEDPPRRPWQWVGFGALAIVTVWVPLAALAGAIAQALAKSAESTSTSVAIALVYAAALSLGAAMGGYLVGRWGTAAVRIREAALAGLVAAATAIGITWVAFGPSVGALLVLPLATPWAALGGRWGLRSRRGPAIP